MNTKGTILIVEDEAILLETMRRIIEQCGYNVLSAMNGKEGLKLCEEYDGEINILLTDLTLPYIGGIELAEKATAIREDMRVIFTSGHTEEVSVLSQQPYVVASLKKPFSLNLLKDTLEKAFQSDAS